MLVGRVPFSHLAVGPLWAEGKSSKLSATGRVATRGGLGGGWVGGQVGWWVGGLVGCPLYFPFGLDGAAMHRPKLL